MKYEKFNLEKVKAGKPFGRMKGEDFIKATNWFIVPEWVEFIYPLYIKFEDGYTGKYTLDSELYGKSGILVMAPEEVVEYFNYYPSKTMWRHNTLEEAKSNAVSDCIGQIRITNIGNTFKVEKV